MSNNINSLYKCTSTRVQLTELYKPLSTNHYLNCVCIKSNINNNNYTTKSNYYEKLF